MRYLPRNEIGEIKNKDALRVVAMFERTIYGDTGYKRAAFVITRDKWGKFRVAVDNRSIQSNLTAEGIVRYMANMLEGK